MRAYAHTRAGVKRRAWAQAREGRAGAKLADRSDAHERKRAQGRSSAQACRGAASTRLGFTRLPQRSRNDIAQPRALYATALGYGLNGVLYPLPGAL